MRKMLKRGLCLPLVGVLLALAAPESVRAEDPLPAGDVGRYLGMSLSCGCIAEDSDYLAAFYYAVFAEDFDQSYAEVMSGEMRFHANKEWRNQDYLCSVICPSEFMANMADFVEHADVAMSSAVFREYFDRAYASYTGQAFPFNQNAENDESFQKSEKEDGNVTGCSADDDIDSGDDCEAQMGQVSVVATTNESADTGSNGSKRVCYGTGCEDRQDSQAIQESQVSVASATEGGEAEEPANYGQWQMCYWRLNSPICKDLTDPASPVGN